MSALILPLLRIIGIIIVLEAQTASLVHACRGVVALYFFVSRVSGAKATKQGRIEEVLTPVALVGEERYLLLKIQLVQKWPESVYSQASGTTLTPSRSMKLNLSEKNP